MMITRTLLILFFLLPNILLWGQAPGKAMISVKEITENPWPFEISPAAIQDHYGDILKKEKYTLKNRFNRSQKDTIIRFFKGKTEIFFYQPFNNAAFFLAANVYDKHIKLKGEIAPGKTSGDFYKVVSYPAVNSDSIKISLPEGAFNTTLILKKDIIHHIKIEARNQNRKK